MIFEESVYFQIGDAKLASFKTALGERPEIVDATLRINNAIGTAGSVIEEVTQFLHFSRQDWVEIYPGYKVSSTEYERRFKGVDIDYFEKVMPSNLFKSFVQTMGSIEGWGIEPENIYKGKD